MTFLTNTGVTKMLCSFRLVLERKTGKEMPESSRLEFLEKVFSKQFSLIRCMYRGCVVQMKKTISTSYGRDISNWKHWDELGLTWYLGWGIYTSILTWTHSQNSYCPIEHLSYDHKNNSSQHKNNHKLCDGTGYPLLSLMESQRKLRKLRQQHNQSFPIVGKAL